MTDVFVTEDTLRESTGFTQTKRLMAWLTDNGIVYRRAHGGRLITTRRAVEAAFRLHEVENSKVEF